jgi:hypothetical protein
MMEINISTPVWGDPWFSSLNAHEKLIWLFILSNPIVNIAGIVRVAVETISGYCKIEQEETTAILGKFYDDKKIIYLDNYLIIVNWRKYHDNNPSISVSINKSINALPDYILAELENINLLDSDRVSTGCRQGLYNNSNINIITGEIEEVKEKKEKKKTKTTVIPDYVRIQEKWNEINVKFPTIAPVSLFTVARKKKVLLRQTAGFDFLEKYDDLLTAISRSDFLKGENNRSWSITFDWLFENDKNWLKVLEGNYNNKTKKVEF